MRRRAGSNEAPSSRAPWGRLGRRLLPFLLGLAGCGGVDEEQRRLCERALAGLHLELAGVEVTGAAAQDPDSVRIEYRIAKDPVPHWLVCRFAEDDRLDLVDLTTDEIVQLSPARFVFLKRFWLEQKAPR